MMLIEEHFLLWTFCDRCQSESSTSPSQYWDSAGQKQFFDGMPVQIVRFWRGNGNKTKNSWSKGSHFISILIQFSLRTMVFTVLAAIRDSDKSTTANRCQNSREPKRWLK
jgi:hypothetical protein